VEFVGARDVLGWIVGRFYLQKQWSAEASVQMDELARYLKDEFRESLKLSEWLDDSTKSIAIEKAEKMGVQFPGPEGRVRISSTFLPILVTEK
jgi:predicted metalloendopeptidase